EPERPAALMEYQPFPSGVMPEPLRSLVVAGARAIGCDEAYIALPALAVCAAAIGSTRRLRIKTGWDAPAILWTVSIGESGDGKSPGYDLATEPVHDRQHQALSEQLAEDEKPERITTTDATIES